MAAEIIEKDPRFKHILTDPRFKRAPRNVRKVTIDPRFKAMFSDKRFKVKYTVDKRGRKVKQSSSDDLRKYYALNEEDDIFKSKVGKDKCKKASLSPNPVIHKSKRDVDDIDDDDDEGHDDDDDHEEDDDDDEGHDDSDAGFVDYARGEGNLESSSSDDDDDDDDDDEDDEDDEEEEDSNEIIHNWAELNDAPLAEETYARLAVCNMNWDRITAKDLYILFNSFKPQGSVINSVTIYPSDFGLKRMAAEDVEGPVELTRVKSSCETSEGSGYSMEKLRQYQLNRLKYYYAVVVCDSTATAETLYSQCDGLEYEHSSSLLDIRFIPDDMAFDDRTATSTCTDADVTKDHQPLDFFTTALQQSNVKLTWDETDPKRVKTMMRKFNKDEVMEMDFQSYLASSEEEYGSDDVWPVTGEEDKNLTEEEKIANYRALLAEALNEDDEKGPKQEMEITFEPGLQETAEQLVQRKLAKKSDKDLTTWETYLKEKKQKKKMKTREVKPLESDERTLEIPAKKRKQIKPTLQEDDKQQKSELELLVMDDDDGGREHFNLKGILKKERGSKKVGRKNKKASESAAKETQDTFKMDVNDPRFSAVYESHEYALDPSNPLYKPTKGMDALVEEGLKHRREYQLTDKDTTKPSSVESSVEDLVKSVKFKVSQHTKTRLKHSRAIHKKRQ